MMAREFPASTFSGYDISHYALGRAAQRLEESGLTNVSFHDPREQGLPSNGSLDLVTTFDWKEVGDAAPSSHPMLFWLRACG